jgi:hypothetical protein
MAASNVLGVDDDFCSTTKECRCFSQTTDKIESGWKPRWRRPASLLLGTLDEIFSGGNRIILADSPLSTDSDNDTVTASSDPEPSRSALYTATCFLEILDFLVQENL